MVMLGIGQSVPGDPTHRPRPQHAVQQAGARMNELKDCGPARRPALRQPIPR